MGCSIPNEFNGYIIVQTDEYGDIRIELDPVFVKEEFDGNIGESVQFDLQIELDRHEKLRRVVGALDVNIVDEKILEQIARCRARIDALAELQDGWLDSNGKKISQDSIKAAQRLITARPSIASLWKIYPTEAGGVLFEFSVGPWQFSIDILSSGVIEFYGINIKTNEEVSQSNFDAIDESFLKKLDAQFERFWDWR